jgi:Family of unknown function (DUF7033)
MNPGTLRIYSSRDAPRLRYIAAIILGEILGLRWELITDKRRLGKHPVINYSREELSDCFNISPDPLLFETGVHATEITVTEWNELPVFFQSSPQSDIPFDIFAASFFLISRYEEYLDLHPDETGRFKASSSTAFKNGFLEIPVVDHWAREMAKALLKKFRTLTFRRNEYKAFLNIDLDLNNPGSNAKGLFRSIGHLFHDLSGSYFHRSAPGAVIRNENDPSVIFDYMNRSIMESNTDARFFIPVGDRSKYDHNPSWKNDDYRSLINKIAERFKTGLHPSFHATANPGMLASEKIRLKSIISREITMTHFHLVRLSAAGSYHEMHKEGITEDYSMGYPEEPGFRAGIARPFYFYNIHEERQTEVRIFPFQLMDSAFYRFNKEERLKPAEVIVKLINETRKAGGTFVSVWHHSTLQDNPGWQGGREVFEFTLNNQIP